MQQRGNSFQTPAPSGPPLIKNVNCRYSFLPRMLSNGLPPPQDGHAQPRQTRRKVPCAEKTVIFSALTIHHVTHENPFVSGVIHVDIVIVIASVGVVVPTTVDIILHFSFLVKESDIGVYAGVYSIKHGIEAPTDDGCEFLA
jgi:hypothetical protein